MLALIKAHLEPWSVREDLLRALFCAYRCAARDAACGPFPEGRFVLRENMPQIQIETVRMVEIAQRLGVASSTISRALRNDPRISLELRKRVRVAADELGYQPNPLVSALMANRRRRGSGGAVDVIALVTNYGGKRTGGPRMSAVGNIKESSVARASSVFASRFSPWPTISGR